MKKLKDSIDASLEIFQKDTDLTSGEQSKGLGKQIDLGNQDLLENLDVQKAFLEDKINKVQIEQRVVNHENNNNEIIENNNNEITNMMGVDGLASNIMNL